MSLCDLCKRKHVKRMGPKGRRALCAGCRASEKLKAQKRSPSYTRNLARLRWATAVCKRIDEVMNAAR